MRNVAWFSRNQTQALIESRTPSYVGQVGNLRPSTTRPQDTILPHITHLADLNRCRCPPARKLSDIAHECATSEPKPRGELQLEIIIL